MPTPFETKIDELIVNIFHIDMRNLSEEDVEQLVKNYRKAILQAVKELVPEEKNFKATIETNDIESLLKAIMQCFENVGHNSCRKQFLTALGGGKE